jgi:hypothetical protein
LPVGVFSCTHRTTLFDYINRANLCSAPGSLSGDQVYALVAWLLAKNEIIGNDAVMNAVTLPAVEMPAQHIVVSDNRQGGARSQIVVIDLLTAAS